ncbi:putative COPII coat assembly protein SEC16 [Tripterygium wilfordii]|uniref:Putative COPII coat assembly protein SEC16 n=1 Tax=Tripterygium wilfordii TaxID=458696 RepID=A0A7J7DW18_TRIWF|nr:putative COPII coat assembly protein SEC16 [Tripterygium wilfordii]
MDELEPPPPSTLRRRNSISTSVMIPNKLALHTSGLPNGTATPVPLDLELVSLNSSLSYTSLKDILPSASTAINSPTATAAASSLYEISIRNRLVKHAAWAYLQPMSSSPDSSAPHFFSRLWLRFSAPHNLVADFFNFVNCQVIPGIAHAFDSIIRLITVRFNR